MKIQLKKLALVGFLGGLIACGGGGSSGSSRPLPIPVIPEIQGLWVATDGCHCATDLTADKIIGESGKVPVHCYHYFSGSRAVSGYMRLDGSQSCNDYEVPSNIAAMLRRTIAAKTNGALYINDPAPGIEQITYAVGTVRNVTGEIVDVTVWNSDGENRNGTKDKGTSINFNYGDNVVNLGGRKIVCSTYKRFDGSASLYMGIDPTNEPQPRSTTRCDDARYTNLERYLKVE